jgi:hypothetical protein
MTTEPGRKQDNRQARCERAGLTTRFRLTDLRPGDLVRRKNGNPER